MVSSHNADALVHMIEFAFSIGSLFDSTFTDENLLLRYMTYLHSELNFPLYDKRYPYDKTSAEAYLFLRTRP